MNEFEAEVIDRLARIETQLDAMPCAATKSKVDSIDIRVVKIESDWKVAVAVLAIVTFAINIAVRFL